MTQIRSRSFNIHASPLPVSIGSTGTRREQLQESNCGRNTTALLKNYSNELLVVLSCRMLSAQDPVVEHVDESGKQIVLPHAEFRTIKCRIDFHINNLLLVVLLSSASCKYYFNFSHEGLLLHATTRAPPYDDSGYQDERIQSYTKMQKTRPCKPGATRHDIDISRGPNNKPSRERGRRERERARERERRNNQTL